MAATIQDVARVSGVSASTVSRAFNHRRLVNQRTRERIYAAAKRLSYVPNASARSLSIGRTHTIALILPLAYSEFFSVLIRGVDEGVLDFDQELLISGSHNNPESALLALRRLNGLVDGFIVVTHSIPIERLIEGVPNGTPTVFLHSEVPGNQHVSVRTENVRAAGMAVRHLIEEGHRRIAIIKGPEENPEARDRYTGYVNSLIEADIEPDPGLAFAGDFTREGGTEAARLILATRSLPTAVFATNDDSAIGLMFLLNEAGVRIPEDVAIIGFDDIPSARYQNPSLSTIHVPIVEMGRKAVEALVAAINKTEDALRALTFQCELRPRASTIGKRYFEDAEPPLVPLTGTR